tara:strand:- start:3637 stop:4116 length:480 start_codon:yes stop_codon:yes gene_type:complete
MVQHSAAELHKIAAETTAKYIYFLLATSGASIAYSIQIANASRFSWPLLLLAAALLSWGISFFAGCKSLQFDISVHNLSFDVQQQSEAMQEAQTILPAQTLSELKKSYLENVQLTNQALNMSGSKASTYLGWQFRTLIFGVVAFVLWRATEFVINAVGS